MRINGLILLMFVGSIFAFVYFQQNPIPPPTLTSGPTNIVSYNMQIFGMTKAGNGELMKSYKELFLKYDLIFVQEIRDESGIAFKELCDSLTGYNCMISSRAGNSISKEQYGVIYNNKSQVAKVIDYNLLNYSGKFERPPLNVLMTLAQVTSIGNVTEYNYYNVSFYVIHTKPENTPSEIYELEQLVQSDTSQYKTVLGDLNMDCDYYSGINFGNMKNLIATGTDTTTSATTCAYDRIIISLPLDSRLGSYGVDYSTNQQMSDHRPVFFQLS